MIEQYLDRLASQFKDSDNLKGLLTAHLLDYKDIDLTLADLLSNRYLDTSVGVQLDGIGEIVGFPRPRTSDLSGMFGFDSDPNARGWGTLSDPTIGGNFSQINVIQFDIDDDRYRLILKAKIIESMSRMTVNDTLEVLDFMFNTKTQYFLPVNLHPRYQFGRYLDSYEISTLHDIKKIIGIDDIRFESMYEGDTFGFAEDDTALGFGTITKIEGATVPSPTLAPSSTLAPSEGTGFSSVGGNFAKLTGV